MSDVFDSYEQLQCGSCQRWFARKVRRGRKPMRCPRCQAASRPVRTPRFVPPSWVAFVKEATEQYVAPLTRIEVTPLGAPGYFQAWQDDVSGEVCRYGPHELEYDEGQETWISSRVPWPDDTVDDHLLGLSTVPFALLFGPAAYREE